MGLGLISAVALSFPDLIQTGTECSYRFRTEPAFSLQSPLKQLIISHVHFVHVHH